MTSLPVCLEVQYMMIRSRGMTLLVISDLWCDTKSVVGDKITRKRILSADESAEQESIVFLADETMMCKCLFSAQCVLERGQREKERE